MPDPQPYSEVETPHVQKIIENINPEQNPVIALIRKAARSVTNPETNDQFNEDAKTAAEIIVNQGPDFVAWAAAQGRLAALKVVGEITATEAGAQLLTNQGIEGLLSSHYDLDRPEAVARLKEVVGFARTIPPIDVRTARITPELLQHIGFDSSDSLSDQTLDTRIALKVAKDMADKRFDDIVINSPLTVALIGTPEYDRLSKQRHALLVHSVLNAYLSQMVSKPESVAAQQFEPAEDEYDDGLPAITRIENTFAAKQELYDSEDLSITTETGTPITVYGEGNFQIRADTPEGTILALQLKEKGKDEVLNELLVQLRHAQAVNGKRVAVADVLNREEVEAIKYSSYIPWPVVSEIEVNLDNT